MAKEQLVSETYSKTARAVDESGIAYRLIDHEAEGQTDKVSALRGHPLTAAAKCIMLIVKLGKKTTRFVLAVVPGDRRVDIGRVRALFHGATYVGFAMRPDVIVVADPSLQANPELFFNAARLDRSGGAQDSRLPCSGEAAPATSLRVHTSFEEFRLPSAVALNSPRPAESRDIRVLCTRETTPNN